MTRMAVFSHFREVTENMDIVGRCREIQA